MRLVPETKPPSELETAMVQDMLDNGSQVTYSHTHQRANKANGFPEWHKYEVTVVKRLDESTDDVLNRVTDVVNYAIRKRVS